jgi:hypothetical protein
LINSNKEVKKYSPRLIFKIELNIREKFLLDRIAAYFGVGKVYPGRISSCQYVVQSVNELKVIIEHFDKYPLITQKRADYELFKQVLLLVLDKQHLTAVGIQKIVDIKASINLGLTEELILKFPNTNPVVRPLVELPKVPHPQWIAGFTDGDGCFMIRTRKASAYKLGYSVFLGFVLSQSIRDSVLMESFIKSFSCGGYSVSTNGEACEYHVYKFADILNIIIPFFKNYPLQGTKSLDFADFCKAAEIVKTKGHLTEAGLEQILEIKSTMNKSR